MMSEIEFTKEHTVLRFYYVHYWPLMASSFIELRKLTVFIRKRYYRIKNITI
jgi:hypothetical protein